ncbi:MAG: class I SAM-dependent methyltransferase [Candidatus Schekmanbacteria bacterium]|nr:class I SAM-dependent methyltransferase [Candidatus Schekmanbacteria bacterium]
MSHHETTVQSYSEKGSLSYEDPANKNFLYGDITVRFIKNIIFPPKDRVVLDLGCGTGFVFDETYQLFHDRGIRGIGVEPADGMRQIAMTKYRDDHSYSFLAGSFEHIPLPDRSVDHIVSTLALHWVESLSVAAAEMRRVLNPGGNADLLMIARDDGARFKKAIVAALRRHLTFGQIMATATLVQRVTPAQVKEAFAPFVGSFDVDVHRFDEVVYGRFADHMKWWQARSSPVIAEVRDKKQFMQDLREELEAIRIDRGIPFDASYLWIKITATESGMSSL